MRSVHGKVVAITGGARGIGLATAKAFHAAGAKVAIGDIDTDLAGEVSGQAGIVGLPLDVTDPPSFAAFLNDTEAQLGRLDVLVNNAGIMPTGLFVDETPAMTDRQVDINVSGVLTGSRLAATRFQRQASGHLVNVASLAGVTGETGVATYCGTKHFVVGFTEALHRELKPHGVGVTTVLPGLINTELSAGTKVPRWASALVCAEPETVAAAILQAVMTGGARVTVPQAMGAVLTAISMLPDRVRFAVAHTVRFDRLASGADSKTREAYHRRITRGSS